MKILVIGASGLIGSHLHRQAQRQGWMSIGTTRRFAWPGLVSCDCADLPGVERLLEEHRPDAAIHTAGFTWADGCEEDPQRADRENALQPAQVAALCHRAGIHFTYISSSYVFDGTAGPYSEEAPPSPINAYARSKWEGEQRVQEACGGTALIPRVITVFGAEAQGKNFAYQVWRAMREGKVMRLPSDQIGNPTSAADIAKWLLVLLQRRERGVWNLAGARLHCTRPEWASLLVEGFVQAGESRHPSFGWEAVPTASLGQRARRPLHAGLKVEKLATLGIPAMDVVPAVLELVRLDPSLPGRPGLTA